MNEYRSGECIDCGAPTNGLRCAKDHGAYLKRLALEETRERDGALLERFGKPGMTYRKLADALGISRPRAQQKVARARERNIARTELGL